MFRKLNPLIYFCFTLFAVLLLSLPWVNAAESDNPPPQPWQINGILAALNDPYPEVQALALEKLAQYKAEDVQTALENPEEITRKAANILQDEKVDLYIRGSIAEVLRNLGETATPHFRTMIGILQDEKIDFWVRLGAVVVFGNLGEAATPYIPIVVSILQDEKVNFWIRHSAAEALRNLGEAATPYIQTLVSILEDEKVDFWIRLSAAEILGNLGEAATPHIQTLVSILEDEKVDFWVRLGAAEILGKQGDALTSEISIVLNILQDEKVDLSIRGTTDRALENMRQLKTEEVVVILENLYDDAPSDTAEWRFRTYFLGGGTEEVKTLLTWLGRPKTLPNELTREEGLKTLKLFKKIWEPTADLEQLRPELVRQIANVAKKTPWQLTDLPLLQTHYNNLKGKYNAAETLDTIITNLKGRLSFDLTLLTRLAF